MSVPGTKGPTACLIERLAKEGKTVPEISADLMMSQNDIRVHLKRHKIIYTTALGGGKRWYIKGRKIPLEYRASRDNRAFWIEGESKSLIEYWCRGWSISQCAKQLGRTRGSVAGKLDRLGLLKNRAFRFAQPSSSRKVLGGAP